MRIRRFQEIFRGLEELVGRLVQGSFSGSQESFMSFQGCFRGNQSGLDGFQEVQGERGWGFPNGFRKFLDVSFLGLSRIFREYHGFSRDFQRCFKTASEIFQVTS